MPIHQAASHCYIRYNKLPPCYQNRFENVQLQQNVYTYIYIYICNTTNYFDSQMAPISFHCIHNYSIKSNNPIIYTLILLFPLNSIKEKLKRQIQTQISHYHVFGSLCIYFHVARNRSEKTRNNVKTWPFQNRRSVILITIQRGLVRATSRISNHRLPLLPLLFDDQG